MMGLGLGKTWWCRCSLLAAPGGRRAGEDVGEWARGRVGECEGAREAYLFSGRAPLHVLDELLDDPGSGPLPRGAAPPPWGGGVVKGGPIEQDRKNPDPSH